MSLKVKKIVVQVLSRDKNMVPLIVKLIERT